VASADLISDVSAQRKKLEDFIGAPVGEWPPHAFLDGHGIRRSLPDCINKNSVSEHWSWSNATTPRPF
jgi:hypothetical protein